MRTEEQKLFEQNCNDCKHLIRSFYARQCHVDATYEQQKRQFNTQRLKLIESAEQHFRKGNVDKGKAVLKDARKLKFQFDESQCSLSYGRCAIGAKTGMAYPDSEGKACFSFIPEILDEDNINCFELR